MSTNLDILIGGLLGFATTITALAWFHPEAITQLIQALAP